jgi:hypothetical protein
MISGLALKNELGEMEQSNGLKVWKKRACLIGSSGSGHKSAEFDENGLSQNTEQGGGRGRESNSSQNTRRMQDECMR